jgi:hypothetical protein
MQTWRWWRCWPYCGRSNPRTACLCCQHLRPRSLLERPPRVERRRIGSTPGQRLPCAGDLKNVLSGSPQICLLAERIRGAGGGPAPAQRLRRGEGCRNAPPVALYRYNCRFRGCGMTYCTVLLYHHRQIHRRRSSGLWCKGRTFLNKPRTRTMQSRWAHSIIKYGVPMKPP